MFIQNGKYKLATIEELTEVIAGGDKPEDISDVLTTEYRFPVYANGIENEGLQCYSKVHRVDKAAVTISARGTIGATFIRKPYFTPVVRLIAVIPRSEINVTYLKFAIDAVGVIGNGSSQQQLTVPNIKKELIPVPPLGIQLEFETIVRQSDKSKFAARICSNLNLSRCLQGLLKEGLKM